MNKSIFLKDFVLFIAYLSNKIDKSQGVGKVESWEPPTTVSGAFSENIAFRTALWDHFGAKLEKEWRTNFKRLSWEFFNFSSWKKLIGKIRLILETESYPLDLDHDDQSDGSQMCSDVGKLMIDKLWFLDLVVV